RLSFIRAHNCAWNSPAFLSLDVGFWQILLQKSFPLVTKNSPGCRRDFRVKMWGTSSPDDKLTGDLAEATEATKIAGRRSDRPMAGKLSPRNFGLLQQYRH